MLEGCSYQRELERCLYIKGCSYQRDIRIEKMFILERYPYQRGAYSREVLTLERYPYSIDKMSTLRDVHIGNLSVLEKYPNQISLKVQLERYSQEKVGQYKIFSTFIQVVQFEELNSKNFSYSLRHLSNSRNCK